MATVRLIKRAPSGDQVEVAATAKVVKIGVGDNPLVHCWAFTCTDETGAPYHDLQGDAISPDDFIKAAEEFMYAGAAVDEMHSGKQSSRVAFAYPVDGDVARAMFGKAIGEQIKTVGLMVAIRPSAEALAGLRSGEYTGVSIAGSGTRELVKAAAGRVRKRTALTSIAEGHQHSIDLDEPASCYRDRLSTSYQVAEGSEEGHCHAWVYDATTGAVTIALDSGHDHTVAEVVPAEVLAAALVEPAQSECAPSCAQPAPSGGPSITVVTARAPAGVSTRPGVPPTVVPKEMPTVPTAEETRIAELTKQVARLEQLSTLTDSQRAHHAQLRGGDAEAFLAKSHLDRESVLKAITDADLPVYKTAGGIEIRKSDGPVALELAKQADLAAKQQQVTTELLAKAQAATETAAIEKRATADLGHFAKALPVHVAIVRAIDGIADEAVRKDAHEALKAADVAMKALTRPHGGNPGTAPVNQSELEAWNEGLAAFAKAQAIKEPIDAVGPFLKTATGRQLKDAYDQTRGYAEASSTTH